MRPKWMRLLDKSVRHSVSGHVVPIGLTELIYRCDQLFDHCHCTAQCLSHGFASALVLVLTLLFNTLIKLQLNANKNAANESKDGTLYVDISVRLV
jgi:hypothetical protein